MNEQLLLDTINDLRTQISDLRVDVKTLNCQITQNDKEIHALVKDIMIKLAFLSGAVSFITASAMGILGVI